MVTNQDIFEKLRQFRKIMASHHNNLINDVCECSKQDFDIHIRREIILCIVGRCESDGAHPKSIMEAMHINPSTLSELLHKLECDGFIERKQDPEDKRGIIIFLTEAGKARAAIIHEVFIHYLDEVFDVLTQEEKEQLYSIMDKLTRTNR